MLEADNVGRMLQITLLTGSGQEMPSDRKDSHTSGIARTVRRISSETGGHGARQENLGPAALTGGHGGVIRIDRYALGSKPCRGDGTS